MPKGKQRPSVTLPAAPSERYVHRGDAYIARRLAIKTALTSIEMLQRWVKKCKFLKAGYLRTIDLSWKSTTGCDCKFTYYREADCTAIPTAQAKKAVPDPDWLTIEEAKSQFGWSLITLQRYKKRGIPVLERKLTTKSGLRYVDSGRGWKFYRPVVLYCRRTLQELKDLLEGPRDPYLAPVSKAARESGISLTRLNDLIGKKQVTAPKLPTRHPRPKLIQHVRLPLDLPIRPPLRQWDRPRFTRDDGTTMATIPDAAGTSGIPYRTIRAWYGGEQCPWLADGEAFQVDRREGRPFVSLSQIERIAERRRRALAKGWQGKGTIAGSILASVLEEVPTAATAKQNGHAAPPATNGEPHVAAPPIVHVASDGNEIPPEYRDHGKATGGPLTVEYLSRPETFGLCGGVLSRNYGPGKKLTDRLKVGRGYVYRYSEVVVLRDQRYAGK